MSVVPAPTRIIDAHNHPDWLGYDAPRFVENMDEHGIERTWLLAWECPPDEFDPHYIGVVTPVGTPGPIAFARCVRYQERYPDRFILGYAPDPRVPGAIQRMQAAIDHHGVRVYGELKLRMMVDNPDALRMFRFCGERNVPVIIHFDYPIPAGGKPRWSYWYSGTIETFERALAACPDTTFLGHAPGFWAHISGDDNYDKVGYPKGKVEPGGKLPGMLRRYPNLYCDLSAGSALNALSRDPEFGRNFVLEFQDRLLFARDGFDGRLRELLDSFGLAADVREKVFAGNALKLVPDGE